MERGDHHWSHRASTTASSNSSFRRFQSSKSEVYLGGEDGEIEEECKQEFLCPFCGEEFDVVGLFCHIEEEHPVELRNGVCPVCAKRVGMDMVYHITMQHGNILKRKRRSRKGASSSILSLLKKELRDVNLQSLLEGSSYLQFSSNSDLDIDQNPDPDPLLSSFIYSSPSTEVVVKEYLLKRQAHLWKPNRKMLQKATNALNYQTRMKRSRLEDLSLSSKCCSLPFSMTFYEP